MRDGTLPEWWIYPTQCGNGHAWGPGKVIVSWLPCQCAPARAEMARGSGHRTISCRAPGCRYVCYEPAHEPEAGGRLVPVRGRPAPALFMSCRHLDEDAGTILISA